MFASAERNLVFGINDFDETLPGAWEWDLKRLAASAVVAGRFIGGDKVLCEEAARAAVGSYRKRMREYARMGHLEVWYSRIDEEDILAALSPEAREAAEQIMAKARQRGHVQVLEKMARAGGRPAPHRRGQAPHRPGDAHGGRAADRGGARPDAAHLPGLASR